MGGYAASRIGVRVPALVGLALAAVCFVLLTTWDETIADPRLSLHLAIGGLGFGLLIAPFTVAAVEAAGDGYRATAAAWITASRMFGMTAGLAAMSALGVDYLQSLAGGLPVPIQLPGESAAAFSERVAAYEEGISNASFDVFRLFFRSGLVLVVLADSAVDAGCVAPGAARTLPQRVCQIKPSSLSSRAEPDGPHVPCAYVSGGLASGDSQHFRRGSTMFHASSIWSARMKRLASPSIASSNNRSYASGSSWPNRSSSL